MEGRKRRFDVFTDGALKCEDNWLETNVDELLTWFVNKLLIQLPLFRN